MTWLEIDVDALRGFGSDAPVLHPQPWYTAEFSHIVSDKGGIQG
jgi:predicted amidohydrolase YtcJ